MRYRHTWNVVTVEGSGIVDATFDNSSAGDEAV